MNEVACLLIWLGMGCRKWDSDSWLLTVLRYAWHNGPLTYLECRLFAEYLGVESMLAIVCKTYEGVKALETYDKEGCINTSSGLHGLGASIGRALDGRFLVICLENLM